MAPAKIRRSDRGGSLLRRVLGGALLLGTPLGGLVLALLVYRDWKKRHPQKARTVWGHTPLIAGLAALALIAIPIARQSLDSTSNRFSPASWRQGMQIAPTGRVPWFLGRNPCQRPDGTRFYGFPGPWYLDPEHRGGWPPIRGLGGFGRPLWKPGNRGEVAMLLGHIPSRWEAGPGRPFDFSLFSPEERWKWRLMFPSKTQLADWCARWPLSCLEWQLRWSGSGGPTGTFATHGPGRGP